MLEGNFSFAILVIGILQLIIMIFNIYFTVRQYKAYKRINQRGDRRNE